MKVSKRDFLKILTTGGTVAAGAAIKIQPKNTEELPALDPSDPHVLTAEESQQKAKAGDHVLRGFLLPAYLDAVDNILWDRVRFRPGQTIMTRVGMFDTPIGLICPATLRVKTESETNMYQPRRLSAPNHFWVNRIHIGVNEDISAKDYMMVTTLMRWSQWLGHKRYSHGPMFLDAHRLPNSFDSMADRLQNLRMSTRQAMQFPHSKGLLIPPGMEFRGEFEGAEFQTADQSGNGIELFMAWEGIEYRGVQ